MTVDKGLEAHAAPQRTSDLRAREPKAIHRALRVLEAVAEIGLGATAKEVSRALDFPTATTYRLLNLLVQDGYLVRTPDLKAFALGQKVTDLAGYVTPVRLPQAVRDLLGELRSQLRAGAHFVVYEAGHFTVADADPLFPMDVDSRHRIASQELRDLLQQPAVSLDPQHEPEPRSLGGQVCIAAAVHDESGSIVAGIVIMAAVEGASLGRREHDLLEQYIGRLAPLIV